MIIILQFAVWSNDLTQSRAAPHAALFSQRPWTHRCHVVFFSRSGGVSSCGRIPSGGASLDYKSASSRQKFPDDERSSRVRTSPPPKVVLAVPLCSGGFGAEQTGAGGALGSTFLKSWLGSRGWKPSRLASANRASRLTLLTELHPEFLRVCRIKFNLNLVENFNIKNK